MYDRVIQKQQDEIIVTANRSHAIVSSLFPSNVRDQLFPTETAITSSTDKNNLISPVMGPPIAELYPETTVLFCDVVDFTKWSSGKFLVRLFEI